MKKWATDSLLAWTLLAVGGGLAAQTVATNGQAQSVGKLATTTTTTCPPATRYGSVKFNPGGTITVSPSPYISACAGDKIEWTFENATDKKKKVLLNDPDDFLDDDNCKDLKRIPPKTTKKADCKVAKDATNGKHKYEIVGSYYVDPEVEVQGGVRDPDEPAPNSSPSTAPSPR